MNLQNLYLVRHAETILNGKYCGSIDAPLSPNGHSQAKKLSRYFTRIPLEVSFISDLKRTVETSEYLLKNKKTLILKCPNLREIKFGEWEGKDYKSVSEQNPKTYSLWMKKPEQIKFPKGESFSNFYKRIGKFAEFLLQTKNKNVLVVAHGGTLAVLKIILLKESKSKFWSLVPTLASVAHLKRVIGKDKFSWVS